MCQTVLDSEHLIHAITAACDFVSGSTKQKADRMRLKDLVGNENIVKLLQKALALLSPIDALIVKYLDDNVPISEVTPDSFAIVQAHDELERQDIISETECQFADHDLNFFMGMPMELPIYLIHGCFLGSGLSPRSGILSKILFSAQVKIDFK